MSRKQIDAAIAKDADSESLYDQPYEDNKRVRVSAPSQLRASRPIGVLSVQAKIDMHKGVAG